MAVMMMMVNSSQVGFFTLSAYIDMGPLRYLLFLLLLALYVSILGSNLLLVVMICLKPSLHEPMYVFLCSLFVTELFGSSAMFPFLLFQVLSDLHHIPAPLCLLQNFLLYTYAGVEFLTLAVMSYDRYLAICRPLQYHQQMTAQRVAALIAAAWICTVLLCIVMSSLTRSLQLCGTIIEKVYCDNYSVVKLACSDTTANNIYGAIINVLFVLCPLALIFYTYGRILKVCFSGSKQTRQKAISTCTPHLACILNFSCAGIFEVLQSRFNMDNLPDMLRLFLSLYWLTSPPLFNPLLYGLNMSKIRIVFKSWLSSDV